MADTTGHNNDDMDIKEETINATMDEFPKSQSPIKKEDDYTTEDMIPFTPIKSEYEMALPTRVQGNARKLGAPVAPKKSLHEYNARSSAPRNQMKSMPEIECVRALNADRAVSTISNYRILMFK